MNRPTPLERAYELARSGQCSGVVQIRKRLDAEGYSVQQVTGKGLMDDLLKLCRIARGLPAEARRPPPPPATAEERSARSRKAAATRYGNARPPASPASI
jgi:hypothetical protein